MLHHLDRKVRQKPLWVEVRHEEGPPAGPARDLMEPGPRDLEPATAAAHCFRPPGEQYQSVGSGPPTEEQDGISKMSVGFSRR